MKNSTANFYVLDYSENGVIVSVLTNGFYMTVDLNTSNNEVTEVEEEIPSNDNCNYTLSECEKVSILHFCNKVVENEA